MGRREGFGGEKLGAAEGFPVAGVYGTEGEALEALEAGDGEGRVGNNGTECGRIGVLEQVAAEQVAFGGEQSDRASRMAGDVQDFGVDAVGSEIEAFFEVQVGLDPLVSAESGEQGSELAEDGVGFAAVGEHVAAGQHGGVSGVDGDLRPGLATQVGGVAGVVEIAVGEQDQAQLIGEAAEALELGFEAEALAGEAGVDE